VQRRRETASGLAREDLLRLLKPVRPSALEALLQGLFAPKEPAPDEAFPRVGRAAGFLRILLAEDNLVNRKLITTLLKKRGWEVQAFPDGKSALKALKRNEYDAVLMDIQMPVMDGMEVTRAIRREEAGSGRHVPIIALTAHAMMEDRELCLNAGMDDYIAKPIRAAHLISVLEKWAVPAAEEDRRPSPINMNDIRERLGIETDVVLEMLDILMEDAPAHIDRIREALAKGDADALTSSAHRLKGAAGNLGAEPLYHVARDLEALGRQGNLPEAEKRYPVLREEIARIASFVEARRGP
jgi:CheY-like chemotaxis protein/HPt (histidine-containing phosphotransfer) domain-containing protein